MSSPDHQSVNNMVENKTRQIPIIVILGPTAVGKTDASIKLAERFGGQIVSADSRLFYRGMDIGTAKPTPEERARVRHHLIDVADPDEIWSLGVFQKKAHNAIRDIHSRNHIPFLVGGTGQYMRAVIEGWSIPAVEPNEQLRQVLTQWGEAIGAESLHSKLALIDPMAAATIDPTNVRRTIRALEVILSTGRRFSDQRLHGMTPYQPLLLGITCPRAVLYNRIDERITKMLQNGFVEEVRRLLDKGYSPELPTLTAIGYGEIVAYLQGKITLDDAITLMKRRTRIFVRRQANWFKQNDPQIHWFQAGEQVVDQMAKTIGEWLFSI